MTSSIRTGTFDNETLEYANCQYSRAVPAVIYQYRAEGRLIRVEREGKGDHLMLNRHDGVWQIVLNGSGVVGRLGWSRHSDSYVVQRDGVLDFRAVGSRKAGNILADTDNLGDAIGEAGIYFLS